MRLFVDISCFNQSILLARKSYNQILTKEFKDFQRLSSLFHTIQRLFKDPKDLHSNLKTFKDFKDRYEPCSIITSLYMSSICHKIKFAFLTMTNIRHFWVASNSRWPMQTIKTMWKAIFQNKLTIYKANLPSLVQKIIKSRCMFCGLISQTSAEKPPKNGGVRKANWLDSPGLAYPGYQSLLWSEDTRTCYNLGQKPWDHSSQYYKVTEHWQNNFCLPSPQFNVVNNAERKATDSTWSLRILYRGENSLNQ
jgi:hypothetical protein